MKNTWSVAALSATLVFAVFTLLFCSPVHLIFDRFADKPPIVTQATKEYGDGALTFTLYVTWQDDTSTEYILHTNRNTIGGALAELKLAEFADTFRGRQPITIDGVTTDAAKGTYWGVYVNFKYMNAEPDTLLIFPDTIYELRFEEVL